jgi:Leucine-rich repeat (LRR) protein
MRRLWIIYLFLIILFSGLANLKAQEDTELDTATIYTDFKFALKHGDEVIKLSLKKQKLSRLPEELFTAFPNLLWLELSKNHLDTLDQRIAQLQNLQYLDVSKNVLTTLPESIGKLKKLKRLIVSQNKLESLPIEMGQMESLEYLDAWSNDLPDLPHSLISCKNLKEVDVRVVAFSESKKKEILNRFPGVIMHVTPGCNCGN